jgi:hypothetical protein
MILNAANNLDSSFALEWLRQMPMPLNFFILNSAIANSRPFEQIIALLI